MSLDIDLVIESVLSGNFCDDLDDISLSS